MSNRPILPRSADIIAPAIAALVAHRPRAFNAVNLGQGVYSHIFAGFRAQAELAIARLADGVIGNTASQATGLQLQTYLASEYEIPPDMSATKALGTCRLDRSASTAPMLGGTIQKGKKIRRDAIINGTVPLTQAEYVTGADTAVFPNQAIVDVPIVAVRATAAANTPNVVGVTFPPLVLADSLFDKNFVPTTYDVGGGSDGFQDADLLRYAGAYAVGQFGCNDDALKLVALRASGVRKILVVDDQIYIADPSWGGSSRWVNAVTQSMSNDDLLGYAVRFGVSIVPSYPIYVNLTVRLRDIASLSDTSELDTTIADAVRSYFDDRDDFDVVATSPLRSVVSRADTRILRCTSASINNLDGSTFAPSAISHAYLTNVNLNYLPPV